MSAADPRLPALLPGFLAVVRRDLLLGWRRPGDVLNPLFFYVIVATLFPFALGPDAARLALIGPGVLWVAALLATLLSLNSLYLADHEDGSLEQLLTSAQPLPLLALAKAVAHWLLGGLPLVIVSPVAAYAYGLPAGTIRVLLATLALGTASLSLLGSIGAALTVGLNRASALLGLLVLPLAIPLLIFGARTVALAAAGDAAGAGLYFLGAYCTLALALAPFAAAAALKVAAE
ncbi:MAG TPA: heme exporter protein CcmB [Woeseiaceae bacterium]|nr:heme exporter protein CcmB [Woeseiaceae bacterium]